MSRRKIIHIDADSFYASVEMREAPELRGKPVAVGGRAHSRGVIATCNYEARSFGVHSAMPSRRALQLCPTLIILKPRFDLYRQVSRQFHAIFSEYTDIIEPLSLDEAYLDVTHCTQCSGSATLIAEEIRQRIKRELNLTVSAGVAPNKFLAKVGSDWEKPDGCYTIAPHQVDDFVRELPVSNINGVGAVTAAKLERMGVKTCGQLQQLSPEVLAARFGKYGTRLSQLARGEDDRPVSTHRIRKSISVESTYGQDLLDMAALEEALQTLLLELETRFEKITRHYVPQKRIVKVKFDNFRQTTMEEAVIGSPSEWLARDAYHRLLHSAWSRARRPVRLLGAGLRLKPRGADGEPQISLFDTTDGQIW